MGVLTALLLTLAAVLATAVPASATAPTATRPTADDERVGFGVVPARGNGADERSFFSFALTPGTTAFDRVAILNYSRKPLTLRLAALDALNSDTGGFALQPTAERAQDLGSWISFGDKDGLITVPGRTATRTAGTTVVPVTIKVPTDASPGDHGAGIAAILTTRGHNPQGQDVNLEQRVAARVYVDVDGPARPGVVVSELAASYAGSWLPWQGGHVDVDYSVVNSGNLRLGISSAVTTSGPLGLGRHSVTGIPTEELLPHNEQRQSVRVDSVWPLLRTRVTITATPTAAPGALAPDLAPVVRSVTLWTVPQWLPVLLLLLALAVALGVWRHRHRPPPGAHSDRARQGTAKPPVARRPESVGVAR
jgi:hypothetical protein